MKAKATTPTTSDPAVPIGHCKLGKPAVDAFDAIDLSHDDLLDLLGGLIVSCQAFANNSPVEMVNGSFVSGSMSAEELGDAFRGLKVILGTVREQVTSIKAHVDAIYELSVEGGVRD